MSYSVVKHNRHFPSLYRVSRGVVHTTQQPMDLIVDSVDDEWQCFSHSSNAVKIVDTLRVAKADLVLGSGIRTNRQQQLAYVIVP